MKIGSREVGPGAPVFVIAEIGSNHGGSLDRALALIDAAADAGADAAKFQYFRVDRFIVPRENPESLRRYELPDFWMSDLKDRCTARGIEFLCTAFDYESLNFVDAYVDAHKIGSWEAEDFDYCLAVSGKQKPVIGSLGKWGNKGDLYGVPTDYIPLICKSAYPASIDGYLDDVDLRFKWGVSDHTLHPTIVPAAAVALGACVVEKHFRPYAVGERYGVKSFVDVQDSPDFAVSIPPDKFKALVEAVRLTEKAVRG